MVNATPLARRVCTTNRLIVLPLTSLVVLFAAQVTAVSGPNGHIDWLNCGLHGAGWSPASVRINELVVVPLDSARHTTFAPCSDQAIATFKKYGKKYGSASSECCDLGPLWLITMAVSP